MSAAGKREAKSRKTPGRAGLQEAARSRYRAEAARKESERAARAPHWSANLGQQGQSVPSSQGSPPPPSLPTWGCWEAGEGPPRACVGIWASTKAIVCRPPAGVQGITNGAPRMLGSRPGVGSLLRPLNRQACQGPDSEGLTWVLWVLHPPHTIPAKHRPTQQRKHTKGCLQVAKGDRI